MRTIVRAFVVLAVLVLSRGDAAAADDFAACAEAADKGQDARDQKRFQVAREQFLKCAASTCPTAVRNDCVAWIDDVTRATPTVVFLADAGAQCPVTDVSVSVDANLLLDRIDGRSVPLDPGMHRVRFTWKRGGSQEQQVMVAEGEKNRRISVSFEAPASARAETHGRGPWPWVAGGVGLAALGSFVGFGLSGRAAVSDLERCSPGCDPDRVSSARAQYLVADISLGVALVGFGVATYLFAKPDEKRATPTRSCP